MVSWVAKTGTFLEYWGAQGFIAGIGRQLSDPPRAAYISPSWFLASPGSVDLNAPTRIQRYTLGNTFVYGGETYYNTDAPSIGAGARFAITADDIAAAPGWTFTATMFLAWASSFAPGVIPTPAQIIANNFAAVRDTNAAARRTTAGNIDPAPNYNPSMTATDGADYGYEWPANTKFWLLLVPTRVQDINSTPSAVNDVPAGDVNTLGRAVSMWTNRTPLAPSILTPNTRIVAPSGSTVDLTIKPNDPDKIATFGGDEEPWVFHDVAGVQIQYAPVPTTAVPDPVWQDLPIATLSGAVGPGWHIQDADALPADAGGLAFWQTGKLPIACGATTPVPGAGLLPAGSWQIRVRTFDYGHPFASTTGSGSPRPALNVHPDDRHTMPGTLPQRVWRGQTPDNYPASNTSPWSEPVRIAVSPQVPKPLPLSPMNDVALVAGTPVTLVWQYRNTHTPPYPQFTRQVQIREVGATDWVQLVNDFSAVSSYTISGYTLVSGNHYEWRVRCYDYSANPVQSDWSDPASFWVVPVPSTGSVLPTGPTIKGATLGCGTHRIEVYRRGGKVRVGEITNVSSVEWGRTRDDISTARVVVSGWGIDCGNLLARLQSWAYEVVIFRDNGYTVDRVWEGPITLLTYENNQVTIHAKDLMVWAYRRIIKQQMVDSGNSPTAGSSVVDRATRILMNAFAPDDPRVLEYLTPLTQDDDPKQYRSTPAYSRTAFEEVDDMAANSGLDYTVVGRRIMLWSTRHRIGTLPEFTDKDLGSSPIVSEYGMSMANLYAVSDGNGVFGEADRLNGDDEDPTYGLVEMLSSTWASDSEEETGTYTQEGLATIKASFEESAERSIADRYPPPVVVRVPDNTRLEPSTVISIQHLVPGVVIPLRSMGTLRTVRENQKLDAVKVTESGGVETITVTMSPFTRDDAALDGGEEG